MSIRLLNLRKKTSLLLAVMMVFSLISIPTALAADPEPVAAWNYTAAPVPASSSAPATDGVLMTGAILTNSGDRTLTTSTSSLSLNGWDNGADTKYWQLSLSTAGYENLTLAAKTRSSGTGPRDFKVIYSLDGSTWADVPSGSYQITTTTLSYFMPTITLPADAANAGSLLIRFIMTSNISSRAGTSTYAVDEAIQSGGTSQINNIVVTGTAILSTTKVSVVAADPAGGAVAEGSKVALSCDTEGAAIMYSLNGVDYQAYDAEAQVTLSTLPVELSAYGVKDGMDNGDTSYWDFTKAQVAAVTANPNSGAVSLDSQVTLSCDTPGAQIKYSLDAGATWNDYSSAITLSTLPASIQAYASAAGLADSEISTFNYTKRTGVYNIYFGQLHSHTTNSDGIGTVNDAYNYAKNTAGVDFLAITDHSNSLDNAATASMANGSMSTEWTSGHTAADSYTDSSFVGIYAFEMTWSNGTGHMNTFNTPGFETRENAVYKAADGLQQYYNVLKLFPDSISQFNHPGATFGDFNDFANYDPVIDQRISLVEVGNGEGAVGSGGYFPSYEYYTRALDKGWHLAPTNNQDNHLGKWGNANTARTVILAESLTRDNVYEAMRNMHVYATEDDNLSIKYTLNGEIMGTILPEKPGSVDISVNLQDPDGEALGKVSVISNGGRVVASQTLTTSEDTVSFDLSPDYSYYYIRVDEADGDIAVTAPVWIDEVDKAGISKTTSSTALTLKGQPLTITTSLYNNETAAMNITSLEYSIGGNVIHTASAIDPVASLGTFSYSFSYTPNTAGKFDVNVRLIATIDGVEKTFTDVLKLNVVDPAVTTKIVVDASHYNDYVSGYYSGNMANLVTIANQEGMSVVINTAPLTADVLSDVQLLILSAPAKKTSGTAYVPSPYTEAEIAAIENFADNGGNIIVTAMADYQDNKAAGDTTNESAFQQNRVLAAIGAGISINDDEVVDYDNNPNVPTPGVAGGTPYRVPMKTYNTDSPYLNGVDAAQSYSFYSGCSFTMGPNATWLVKGWPSTYGFDSDNDGLGGSYVSNTATAIPADTGIGKGNVVALAAETLPGGGKLFVGGTVFYSNFEVKAQLDNYSQLQNSNYNILMNILDSIRKVIPVTNINEVRAGNTGDAYCVEGIVTAGKTPSDNAFFDTIYVQDATGGINIFPVSGSDLAVGQKVKVTGTLDQYQGDLELRVIDISVTDTAVNPVAPAALGTHDAMDTANGGKLVKVTGIVTSMDSQNLYIDDGSGAARVFVDGYIGDGSGDPSKLGKWDENIAVGSKVSAIGLASVDTAGPRLRVRNTSEITIEALQHSIYALSTVGIPTELHVGQEADVDVTLNAVQVKDTGYSNVRVNVEAEGPGSAHLLATDTAGHEYDVAEVGYWGPTGGFPIANIYSVTTPFTCSFEAAGDYTITLSLVDMANSEAVITSIDISITVYCNVTFDSQGGSTVAGVLASSTITEPAAPTRTGYVFGGWYKDAGCTDDWNFAGDTVTGDITLFAKWSAITSAVTFNASGGKVTPSSKQVTFDGTYGDLPIPVKTGYYFFGWYTGANGVGTLTEADDIVKITVDTTLYARWGANALLVLSTPSLTAKAPDYKTVVLTWKAVAGAKGYEVYKKIGSTYSLINTVDGALTYTDTNVKAGTYYYYKIRAYNKPYLSNVYSGYSYIKSAKPAWPTLMLKAVSGGHDTIVLDWNDIAGADKYEVYRNMSYSGTYTRIGIADVSAYTDTGLATGKTYYYKIRPFDETEGDPVYGPYSGYRYAKPAWPVLSLNAASGGYDSIVLDWNDIAGADKYQVYRNTSYSGTYTLIDTVDVSAYTDDGLTTGKRYYYKIRPFDENESGPEYAPYSSYRYAKPVPSAPGNITLLKSFVISVNVSWDAVEGASGYEVYRATSLNGTYYRVATTNELGYEDIGLYVSKTYYYKVRAYTMVGTTKVYGPYSEKAHL